MARTIEVDNHRGLARTRRFANAELSNQAVTDELGDEVGDCDACQPRLPGKVSPTHGAVMEERLENEGAIVGTGVLGQHLCPAKTAALHRVRSDSCGIRGRRGLGATSHEGVRGPRGRAALHFRCSHVC